METTLQLAGAVLEACRSRGWRLATAESCTGGLIIGALTEVAGSSDVVDRGFVTYSNAAKSDMLGVDPDLIGRHGAVSAQVAAQMSRGALSHSLAQLAVSVTGIAGPAGGTADKPVGLVFISIACAPDAKQTGDGAGRKADEGVEVSVEECRFGSGSREQVRSATVVRALELLLARCSA